MRILGPEKVLLGHGKILEQGSRTELLKLGNRYAKLVELQAATRR